MPTATYITPDAPLPSACEATRRIALRERIISREDSPVFGTVIADGLNLRPDPGNFEDISGEALRIGECPLILERTEEPISTARSDSIWYRIFTYRGETGWVSGEYIDLRGDIRLVPVSE